jgi:hypothetical protein
MRSTPFKSTASKLQLEMIEKRISGLKHVGK